MSPCHLFEHFKDKCIKAVLKNLYVILWAEVSSWHCFLTLQKILMGGKISHWKQWGINRSLRLLGPDSSQLCPTMLTASRPVFKKQKCCCACGLGSSGFWLGCFFFSLVTADSDDQMVIRRNSRILRKTLTESKILYL